MTFELNETLVQMVEIINLIIDFMCMGTIIKFVYQNGLIIQISNHFLLCKH